MVELGSPQWQGYQRVPVYDNSPPPSANRRTRVSVISHSGKIFDSLERTSQSGQDIDQREARVSKAIDAGIENFVQPSRGEISAIAEVSDGLGDVSPGIEIMEQVFDIPEDAYGAGMLAIIVDITKFLRGEDTCMSFVCLALSLGLLLLNLFLQGSILVYVYKYVVKSALRRVQVTYKEFRAEIFTSQGEFQDDVWALFDKSSICQIPLSNLPFYYCVIACWTLTAMREIKASHRLMKDAMSMPSTEYASDMILRREDGDDEHLHVVALTCCARLALLLFVCIPKLCISLGLLWLGCAWLSASVTFTELVMNAVAMEFITQIDNAVYDAMLPRWVQKNVEEIDFLKRTETIRPRAEIAIAYKWDGIKRTLFYLVAAMLWIFGFSMCLQTVLPFDVHELQHHCATYLKERTTPVCWETALALRDPAKVSDCYPFGRGED